MSADPTEQTFVKKIIIGTPVRKVTGAQAQTLCDLTDVLCADHEDGDLLEYDLATQKFHLVRNPRQLIIQGASF
tara:strand:- start:479 stop:700 length:222 start_codon:yes stop_codon:yes gene_type:complete